MMFKPLASAKLHSSSQPDLLKNHETPTNDEPEASTQSGPGKSKLNPERLHTIGPPSLTTGIWS